MLILPVLRKQAVVGLVPANGWGKHYFIKHQHFGSCGAGAFDPVVRTLKQDLWCSWMTAQNCGAPSKMKFTSACSLGTFGRSIILLLMVIVVIILIITLFFKPTAIQLLHKLLKITWKPNQLQPQSLLPGGEGFYLQHGAREGEEISVPELLLYTKPSWEEQGHSLTWKSARPRICPNMLGNCQENDCGRLLPVSGAAWLPWNLLIRISPSFPCNKYQKPIKGCKHCVTGKKKKLNWEPCKISWTDCAWKGSPD